MDWQGTATSEGPRQRWIDFANTRQRDLGCFLQIDPTLGAAETAPHRPACRRPIRCKGQYRGSFLPPYLRLPYAQGLRLPVHRHGGTSAPAGRRRGGGQDEPGRVRHGLLDGELGPDGNTEPLGSRGAFPAAPAAAPPRQLPAGMVAFGLGSDTGGSVRQPASFCGVYGLKPTWGSVSRFGLVAYASSLEVIGVMAKTVDMTEEVFSVMRGQDPMDHSSLPWQPPAEKNGPVAHRGAARSALMCPCILT